jgi:phytoene/squalene synthetase
MNWGQQGCDECRSAWERASPRAALDLLGTSYELHTRLHRCRTCGSYWDELERYAHQVPEAVGLALLAGRSFEDA